jgi:[ribosomal protein S18]-alanine N-acetyltransferase
MTDQTTDPTTENATADDTDLAGLRRPGLGDVDLIAGWHPMPSAEVLEWWQPEYVRPWLMVDAGIPVAYGELWVDDEEDEVELARLIVTPELRGRGLGKRLTRALMSKAADTGLATTMLRVVPDNTVAIGCYLACGLEPLGADEAAVWNEGQRREWYWMRLPEPPNDEQAK